MTDANFAILEQLEAFAAEAIAEPMAVPSSACLRTNAICASENFEAFMEISISRSRDQNWKIPPMNGLNWREHVRMPEPALVPDA